MTEPYRSQSRIQAQFEASRTAGSWMPWAGAAMAMLLWGGIGAWLFAGVGLATVLAQPPIVLAGGFGAILAPGIALIVAGIMARESARSSEANAIVLHSARLLLAPAETARDEVSAMAEAITRETQNANRALADTRARLDGLKKDIETSVTAALKAAEVVRADSEVLMGKMGSERQSMTQLAESLRNQSENLSKAIPRHAQMMSDAARSAQEQVRGAEDTMRQRLSGMEETAAKLAQRIGQLDTMGGESRKRAQNLASVLSRLDEQLVQSTRMVEAASKAGELASAASKSTAESLRDAVSDALNSAMKATETINERSAQAAEGAREAMLRLKEAGLQAEATTRAAALAAKTHVQETEQRVSEMSDLMFRTSAKAASLAESGLERLQLRMERASLLIGQMKDEQMSSTVDDIVLANDQAAPPHVMPAPVMPAPVIERAPPRQSSRSPVNDLFLARKHEPQPSEEPIFARAPEPLPVDEPVLSRIPERPPVDDLILDRRVPAPDPILRPVASRATMPEHRPSEFRPGELRQGELRQGEFRQMALGDVRSMAPNGDDRDELVLRQVEPPRRPVGHSQPHHEQLFGADPAPPPAMSWRDLLTGIDESPPPRHDHSAGAMIDRLDRAGVRLGGVVKATDLRRIASAAHQGERQRRRAIRDVAPGEIQRVSRLLDADRDLQLAARSFVTTEEPDALRLLAMADRAREDAAPRLSAYLLLDAALGATA